MKIVVVGATGTIGAAVVAALESRHEVVGVSRRSDPPVDLGEPSTVAALFAAVRDIDAIISCGANAPLRSFTESSDEEFQASIHAKLYGQIDLIRQAARHLLDDGSVTVTSGAIPAGLAGSAGGALVNAGLEAFVGAVAMELPRGIRVNAVSPGWVKESLEQLGMDSGGGTPVATVVRSYLEALEGTAHGVTLRP